MTFSRDGKRVRLLDHAATIDGQGLLNSMKLDGARELLGRNVLRYAELPDGRVLAAVNQAFVGPHNRVVIIDEAARTAEWVAAAAHDFELFPSGHAALVGLVPTSHGNAIDWIVLPLP